MRHVVGDITLDGPAAALAARRKVAQRVVRLEAGLFGDVKFFDGIGELRVDKIAAWRKSQAEIVTRSRRPDLWARHIGARVQPPSGARHEEEE